MAAGTPAARKLLLRKSGGDTRVSDLPKKLSLYTSFLRARCAAHSVGWSGERNYDAMEETTYARAAIVQDGRAVLRRVNAGAVSNL